MTSCTNNPIESSLEAMHCGKHTLSSLIPYRSLLTFPQWAVSFKFKLAWFLFHSDQLNISHDFPSFAGMYHTGIGVTSMQSFMSVLEIPSPHHSTMKRREREILKPIQDVAANSCHSALVEEMQASRISRWEVWNDEVKNKTNLAWERSVQVYTRSQQPVACVPRQLF